MRHLVLYELRILIRQRFFYAMFFFFISLMALLFLLQMKYSLTEGFNSATETAMSLSLYVVPLFSMLFVAFSIANDEESGQKALFRSYPLGEFSYLVGKWFAPTCLLLLLITFSFHLLVGILSVFFKVTLSITLYKTLYFQLLLCFFFSIIGLLIGVTTKNRWNSLITTLLLWLVLIVLWPLLAVTVATFLPYNSVPTFLTIITLLNPAELLRVWYITTFQAQTAFGAYYEGLTSVLSRFEGSVFLLLYTAMMLLLYVSILFITKGRKESR